MPKKATGRPRGRPRKNPIERMAARWMVNLPMSEAGEVDRAAKALGVGRAAWLRSLVEWALSTGWVPATLPVEEAPKPEA